MSMEQTWRWFGPKDPVSLKEIKQTGAEGIVSALHHIPVGAVWTNEEIKKHRDIIEAEGLKWSVAESIPVHEDIKKREGNYKQYIENYKESVRNLGKNGIDIVCYNFMPVLDWLRTDLRVIFRDGSITTKFESKVYAAFDLFILKRKNAEKDYSESLLKEAEIYFKTLTEKQKEKLLQTILLGFPGSLEAYTFERFRASIEGYRDIKDKELRSNLFHFIKEIIPAAEEAGVLMAIHPDDPPWPLFGLPRIVSTKEDYAKIINAADSPSNGITLCTGSLGVSVKNDLTDITGTFAGRIHFTHLRNVWRNEKGDFMEENHLEGAVNLYEVMKILLLEQKRRKESGLKNKRMPFRPDHGHLMIPEMDKENIYPGYSLFGRMRGLAELRGLELGIKLSLGL